MHRYWIKFDLKFGDPKTRGALLGCGVTAESLDHAIRLVAETVFRGRSVPQVVSVIEDVDLASLDAGHVLPNIGDPNKIGVWFPAGRWKNSGNGGSYSTQ